MPDFDTWYRQGEKNGWVRTGCLQHSPPFTVDEDEEFMQRFEDGDDPCRHIARVIFPTVD